MLRAYLIPNPGICDCMSHHFTNYTEQKKEESFHPNTNCVMYC